MFPNRLVGRGALGAVMVVAAGALAADPADPKAFDKLIVDTLRDVHNKGADIYNEGKDYDGAFRFYQGSLLTIRPLLAHRPATQKLIDDGIAAADKEADITRKGFILHETIEKVRADLRAEPKKPDDKKPTETKKPDDAKKPAETTPMPKPKDPPAKEPAKADAAAVAGKVTLQGKPLPEGEISFVSLEQKAPKVVTTAVKDGSYSAMGLPPGKYVVAITGGKDVKVPAKYATTDTSGLTVEAKTGANTFDIELK